jgi:predicted RNA-binding Zn ribbon-like protein
MGDCGNVAKARRHRARAAGSDSDRSDRQTIYK